MDRKFILIPALAAGIFLAQSAQQGAQAMSVPTAMISQTASPMLTLADWGGRHGYGGWGRHSYGGWGRHGYGGWGRHGYGGWGRRGYGGGWGRRGGRWG